MFLIESRSIFSNESSFISGIKSNLIESSFFLRIFKSFNEIEYSISENELSFFVKLFQAKSFSFEDKIESFIPITIELPSSPKWLVNSL